MLPGSQVPAKPRLAIRPGARRAPVLADRLVPALLALLILATYGATLHAGFVSWDDNIHVYENPYVVGTGNYWDAWGNWRDPVFYPLTYTSHYLEWRLSNGRPWLFHLDNVLVHAASAVELGFLARALGLTSGMAWATAGLWALHPMQVGTVAWVSERKNVLVVFFYLASLLTYAAGLDASPRRSRNLWLLSVGCAAAALLSKGAAAATVAVDILLLHWARRRKLDRTFAIRLAPYLVLAVPVGVLHVLREGGVRAPVALGTRLLIAPRALWFYVTKFLFPVDLAAVYPRWPIEEAVPRGLAAAAALMVLLGLVVWRRARIPRAAWFGIGHFLVNAAVVVGIFWYGFMQYSFVADYMLYLPGVGLALVVCLAAARVLDRLQVPVGLAAGATLGLWLVLAGMSRQQATIWKSSERLWSDTLDRNPASAVVHNGLGLALLERGLTDQAVVLLGDAIRLDPDDAKAHLNLGLALATKGEMKEALASYEKARALDPSDAAVRVNMGAALERMGDVDTAVAHYKAALRLDPRSAVAHYNLANVLFERDESEDALAHYEAARGLDPRSADPLCGIGKVMLKSRRFEAAVNIFERAIELRPDDADTHYHLALALQGSGRREEAVANLRRALALEPNHTQAHNVLGNMLAEKGELGAAVSQYRAALDAAPESAGSREKLGDTLVASEDYEAAAAAYRAAVAVTDAAGLHTGLAIALAGLGDPDGAIAEYERALALDPADLTALYNLAGELAGAGRTDEAIARYEALLLRAPENADAHNNLAVALTIAGRQDEALQHYEAALAAAPGEARFRVNMAQLLHRQEHDEDAVRVLRAGLDHGRSVDLANTLAWYLATLAEASLRNGNEAVRLAEEACRKAEHEDPNLLDTLAAAYAESGRFADATRTAEHAIKLAVAAERTKLLGKLALRMALYEAGRPYHEVGGTPDSE